MELSPYNRYHGRVNDEGRDCTICKEYKTWDNFNRNPCAKTGYQSRCKQCISLKSTDNTGRAIEPRESDEERNLRLHDDYYNVGEVVQPRTARCASFIRFS